MRTICTVLLGAGLSLTGVTGPLAGQVASIQATATVLEPLTVQAGNDLVFGVLAAGTSANVGPQDPSAGTLSVTGARGREVSISFILPPQLDDVNGSGATIPVSFGATDGVANQVNSPAGGSVFDPGVGFVGLLEALTGNLFVFLGGTVTTQATDAPGDYQGTVTMTVAYTGN